MDKILIYVFNKNNQLLLENELKKRYKVVSPTDNLNAVDFDLIIIDGVSLKRKQSEIIKLKCNHFPIFLPVILLTTKEDLKEVERFLFETVDEILRMPIEKIELSARIEVLLRARLYTLLLSQETIIDPLTGVYNRKYFYEIANKEFSSFLRYGRKFSILFIDIDNFKKINDTYGHLTGDLILKTVSKKLKELIRKSDIVCRFGGEEFVLILHEATLEHAVSIGERIREEIAKEGIKTYNGHTLYVTISGGVTEVNENIKDIQELVEKADLAMYRAKQAGKNRVYL